MYTHLDNFLKQVSIIEPSGHWARRGVKGFESLSGEAISGEDGRSHILRKYIDLVSTSVDEGDGDG